MYELEHETLPPICLRFLKNQTLYIVMLLYHFYCPYTCIASERIAPQAVRIIHSVQSLLTSSLFLSSFVCIENSLEDVEYLQSVARWWHIIWQNKPATENITVSLTDSSLMAHYPFIRSHKCKMSCAVTLRISMAICSANSNQNQSNANVS